MLNLLMKWPLGSNLSQLYKIIWNLWYKNPWISVVLVKKEKKPNEEPKASYSVSAITKDKAVGGMRRNQK